MVSLCTTTEIYCLLDDADCMCWSVSGIIAGIVLIATRSIDDATVDLATYIRPEDVWQM